MIERWTPKIKQEQCAEGMTLRMWTDKEGEYVLYKDHMIAITNLKNQIRIMRESVEIGDKNPETVQSR